MTVRHPGGRGGRPVRDLRYHFPEIEALLRKGEEIEIRKRRKVIARLLPVRSKAEGYPDFAALRKRIFGSKRAPQTGTDLVSEARAVREHFFDHQVMGLFQIEPLGAEVWQRASILSRRHTAKLGARTLDLLHVAAVLVLKPDVFYAFDERQRRLARAERLPILPS